MHKTNMKIFNFFVFAGLGLSSILASAAPGIDVHGVSFKCSAKELKKIEADVDQYLSELKIDKALYHKEHNKKKNLLVYALNTPEKEYDTLHLKESKRYGIVDEDVQMPISQTATTTIKTVSRKEIVLALFQHGRQTQFSGTQCKAESFIDHVGIRQNTVMWAQKLEWQWPEGGPAFWNKKFWDKGTPHKRESVVAAFLDTFLNQKQYGIGCYTATKIVMVQGVLDYYARIKPNAKALDKVIDRLYLDQDPLVNIEPQKMWSFEKDFDQRKLDDPGKILVMQHNVYPQNFVPGDWTYFLNTDEVSQQKTGYEGSNAIYLGNAKFDDYYNDNNHSYTYKEKLDEVYQWSNGVFSRSRDFKKIKPVTENDLKRFGLTPDQGGYVMEYRTHHEFYN